METCLVATTDAAYEVDEGRYCVPMDVVLKLITSPFEYSPWDCDTFTIDDVLAVAEEDACDVPYENDVQDQVVGQSSYHIARIAYLVTHTERIHDEDYPTFSVALAEAGQHPLMDGNHRLAAAIVRGDKTFVMDIDGDVDGAEQLFEMVSVE